MRGINRFDMVRPTGKVKRTDWKRQTLETRSPVKRPFYHICYDVMMAATKKLIKDSY